MATIPAHIRLLLRRRFDGDLLTTEERAVIGEWYREEAAANRLLGKDDWEKDFLDYHALRHNQSYKDAAFQLLFDAFDARSVHATKVVWLQRVWFRYAAAIILIIGTGAYLWNHRQQQEPALTTQPGPETKDIAPGYSKATLTLSDGKVLELDRMATEKINDGQLLIDNIHGELRYGQSNIVATNTMTTPKGGQYQLTLADGTKVWLNAASSITYPTAFIHNERKVKITGEVYFEVAKNAKQPFIVEAGDEEIKVLGTSFNINSYSDESAIKTSLIDGAVSVNNKLLQPGQAYLHGKIIKTNIAQDVAWKNGAFDFNDLSIEQAMRQIARWYDVEVIYDKGIPNEVLSGELHRNINLQDLLSGLEGIAATFKLEGRKIYVRPL